MRRIRERCGVRVGGRCKVWWGWGLGLGQRIFLLRENPFGGFLEVCVGLVSEPFIVKKELVCISLINKKI
jgi:hypothetical protein